MRLLAFTDLAEAAGRPGRRAWDGGTTNALRPPWPARGNLSSLMRKVHHVSRIAPRDLVRGSVTSVTRRRIPSTCSIRCAASKASIARLSMPPAPCRCLVGGDRPGDLADLRALVASGHKLGSMVHFDAHSDVNDRWPGRRNLHHGTLPAELTRKVLLDLLRIGADRHHALVVGRTTTLSSGRVASVIHDGGVRQELGVEATLAEARWCGRRADHASFDVDVPTLACARHRYPGDRRHDQPPGLCSWSAACAGWTWSAPTWWKARRCSMAGGATAWWWRP